MRTHVLAAILLAASSSTVLAAGDLASKVMSDTPGVTSAGKTANPTAKPETGGLAEKAMKDHPGVGK